MSAEKAKKYAQWIVDNQDKKGTPEFATVVKAYEVAKTRIGQQQGMSALEATGRGTNVGLANVLGAIPDLIDNTPRLMNFLPGREYSTISEGVFGLDRNPIGAEAIRDRMATSADLGYTDISEIPENVRPFAKGGEVFSETAALVAPIGLAANAAKGVNTAAQASKATAQGLKSKGRNIKADSPGFEGMARQGVVPSVIDDVLESTAKNPGSAAAIELGMGVTPAIGAGMAEGIAPGDATASMYGQIAGAMSPIALMKSLDLAGSGVRNVRALTGKDGQEAAAARAMQEAVKQTGGDRDAIIAASRAAQAGETTAQATGSDAVKQIENVLARANPEFAARVAAQSDNAINVQNSKIRTVVDEADEAATIDALNTRLSKVTKSLDNLVGRAEAKAIEAQSSLRADNPQGDRISAAKDARTILDDALKTARQAETNLWNKIPQKAQVNVGKDSEFMKARQKVLEEYNMPSEEVDEFWRVQFALNNKTNALNKGKSKLQKKTVAETLNAANLLKLRTQYLREARNVSSGSQPNYQKAAAYRILADGLLDDISRDVKGDAVTVARQYSKQLNDKFNKGYVGKVLGRTGKGDDAVSRGETLDQLSSSNPAKQAKAQEDLMAASEGNPQMMQAQKDFMNTFASAALNADNSLNMTKFNSFLDRNKNVLRQLGLEKELGTVQGKAKFAKALQDQRKQADSFIQNKSIAARAVNTADLGKTISQVTAGTNRNEGISALVRTVKRTGSKEAMDGLRHSMFEHVIKQSSTSGKLSGAKMDEVLNSKVRGVSLREVLVKEGLLNKGQVNGLDRMIARLKQYEVVGDNKQFADVLQKEELIFDTLVRLGAAKAQSASPLAPSGGGAIVAAGAAVRAVRKFLVKNPIIKVQNIMTEAMSDPKLMATLLERPTSLKQQRNQVKRFYAALVSAGIFGATDLMTEE